VCAGYQVLGTRFPGADGAPVTGVGLLDVETVRVAEPRAVGEVVTRATLPAATDPMRFTGFENHAGRTRLGSRVLPLAELVRGVGNGDGATEGAVVGKVLGTYLHGPVLARNPALADHLLRLATGAELTELGDAEERALREERLGLSRTFGAHGRLARRFRRQVS
jgi:CobQ-like glutamine amidotransferase family enzyme